MTQFFDIPVTLNDATETTMNDWAGHCLLIVNTASKCGLTPQYEALEELYRDYSQRGFFVIAMPCNQFAEEEPGSNKQIAEFCRREYDVTFPILEKADVNGENAHPLYQFLKGDGPDIEWNFEKFVVSPEGKVVGRFAPNIEPDDLEIIECLEEHVVL